jgi:hypothetical protein
LQKSYDDSDAGVIEGKDDAVAYVEIVFGIRGEFTIIAIVLYSEYIE